MNKKILIADDHVIVRMALSLIIKKVRPRAAVDEVDDYQKVLDLIKIKSFDLVILDIKMPNGNFRQTMDIIKLNHPNTKVMIFSSQDESLFAIRYLKMGADGFLHKLSSEETISLAINKMLDKGSYISEDVRDVLVNNKLNRPKGPLNPVNMLTDREIAVAERLVKGVLLKDISNELNIHISTVSTYKMRILEKLNINSIQDLIKLFHIYEISD